jgi:hypothetical protein
MSSILLHAPPTARLLEVAGLSLFVAGLDLAKRRVRQRTLALMRLKKQELDIDDIQVRLTALERTEPPAKPPEGCAVEVPIPRAVHPESDDSHCFAVACRAGKGG